MRFVEKLRNRNIPRVAAAYLVSAWLIIQIADTIIPNIGLSRDAVTTVIVIVALGFVPCLVVDHDRYSHQLD